MKDEERREHLAAVRAAWMAEESQKLGEDFNSREAFEQLRTQKETILGLNRVHEYDTNASFEKLATVCGCRPEGGAAGFKKFIDSCRGILEDGAIRYLGTNAVMNFFEQENAFCSQRFFFRAGNRKPTVESLETFLSQKCRMPEEYSASGLKDLAELAFRWWSEGTEEFVRNAREFTGADKTVYRRLQLTAGGCVLADMAERMLPQLGHFLLELMKRRPPEVKEEEAHPSTWFKCKGFYKGKPVQIDYKGASEMDFEFRLIYLTSLDEVNAAARLPGYPGLKPGTVTGIVRAYTLTYLVLDKEPPATFEWDADPLPVPVPEPEETDEEGEGKEQKEQQKEPEQREQANDSDVLKEAKEAEEAEEANLIKS